MLKLHFIKFHLIVVKINPFVFINYVIDIYALVSFTTRIKTKLVLGYGIKFNNTIFVLKRYLELFAIR